MLALAQARRIRLYVEERGSPPTERTFGDIRQTEYRNVRAPDTELGGRFRSARAHGRPLEVSDTVAQS